MPERDDEFFVGYLPPTPTLRRRTAVAAAGLAFLMFALALMLAAIQDDPGGARWDLHQQTTITGLVDLTPYPTLIDREGTWLVVSSGKSGAAERLRPFSQQIVTLRGHQLTRNGSRMLELSDEGGVEVSGNSFQPQENRDIQPSQRVTLRGEIVDSKCFLGAMKPGEGKTHKACAALCIKGGIPPMLVTFAPDGSNLCYIIADQRGNALAAEDLQKLLRYVGDPVELSGRVVPRGQLRLLLADLDSLVRR